MLKRILILGLCLFVPLVACAKERECKGFLYYYGEDEKTRKEFKNNPEKAAWNWFVCLNQKSMNGEAREWESLKPTSEVYLPNGARPTDYGLRVSTPNEVIKMAKEKGMDTSRLFHNLDAKIQVDGLALEMGGEIPVTKTQRFVRYELLMSKGTFDYILAKNVYNVNGQEALTEDLDFPDNAWELKTSWLWVGADKGFLANLKADGYYIVNSYYRGEDGIYRVGYSALSGMHIINKLVVNWVWATFENTNNYKYTITNHIPPTPMTNQTGPNKETKKINSKFQKHNPELSAYQLIGVQWDFGVEPKLLASSQMESDFQSRSSCIACHYTAAYSKDDGYYNFSHKEGGGILYPIDKTPDSEFDDYKKMDFVWSLKRASWER